MFKSKGSLSENGKPREVKLKMREMKMRQRSQCRDGVTRMDEGAEQQPVAAPFVLHSTGPIRVNETEENGQQHQRAFRRRLLITISNSKCLARGNHCRKCTACLHAEQHLKEIIKGNPRTATWETTVLCPLSGFLITNTETKPWSTSHSNKDHVTKLSSEMIPKAHKKQKFLRSPMFLQVQAEGTGEFNQGALMLRQEWAQKEDQDKP